MTAAASTCPAFTPGNLVLSRSLYQGTTSTVTVGQYLPGSTASFTGSETTTSGNVNVTTAFAVGNVVQITTGGVNYSRTLTAVTSTKLTWGVALPSAPVNGDLIGIVAVADGGIPEVWQNETPDASFGVTSPILLDQLSPSATVVNTCAVDPTVMVSSFSSKSELSLNLSPDGTTMTFMGYASPINTLDVSNSNTPGHVDPTDAVQSSYQRIVAQFDPLANFLATPVNAYSGNNGRAAIEANGLGPFGEYTGYAGRGKMNLFLNVTAITHRKKPVWNSFLSQFPPSESSILTKHGLEGAFYKFLRYDLGLPNLPRLPSTTRAGAANSSLSA